MSALPSPETMLTYASILEKPQYVVKNGIRYPISTGEIIEAACAALRHCAEQPVWTEEELAHPFFEYSACEERRCGWTEPGTCDCRNIARRAARMVRHVVPRGFPLKEAPMSPADRGEP